MSSFFSISSGSTRTVAGLYAGSMTSTILPSSVSPTTRPPLAPLASSSSSSSSPPPPGPSTPLSFFHFSNSFFAFADSSSVTSSSYASPRSEALPSPSPSPAGERLSHGELETSPMFSAATLASSGPWVFHPALLCPSASVTFASTIFFPFAFIHFLYSASTTPMSGWGFFHCACTAAFSACTSA